MRRLLVLLALILPAVLPAVLPAQGWIVPRCGPVPEPRIDRPPVVPCPAPAQVVRTGSTVAAELRGRVVHYEIEERFVNRGATIGEADYYFPLPPTAAFQDLRLSIDGELVAGETMSAEEARGVYEAIVRQQRDPALVEWMSHGLLRLRIFPFRAGEERRVVVRLQAVATREGDAIRVDYARGSRTAGSERGAPVRFTLRLPADGDYGRPYSPTHELDVTRRGDHRVVEAKGTTGDVTILLPKRQGDAPAITMVAHAPGGEDGFALLTVTPPARRRGASTPRDFTFVVDVSGSMSGDKLRQAKAAGRQLLATLEERDRFRIIDFASDVRSFRDEFVHASPANVRAAQAYLSSLEASGGTNIAGALEEALRGTPANGRLGLVLFLTDGAPTAGERDPARIAERASAIRRGRRVFSFGVGADVNAALVEQLALEAGGTAHFVRPDESVEHVVSLVASRLVDPVLTDVRIRAEGVRLSRRHPVQPLDLFAGQDLVVLARYAGSGRARVVIDGTSPAGPVRWTQDVVFPARKREDAFVARLWATQRVGWLSAEKRKGGGSSEHDDEIRQLGERFGIPTELTSYLVVEPGMVAGGVGRQRQVQAAAGKARDMAAPPPGAATNTVTAAAPQAQFEAARRDAGLRAARTLADAAVHGTGAADVRHAMGRTFVLDSAGRWTDVNHGDAVRVLTIAPYSPAYFAVIAAVPALQEAFALGERVLVAGRGLAVEVAAGGRERLGDAELRALAGAGW